MVVFAIMSLLEWSFVRFPWRVYPVVNFCVQVGLDFHGYQKNKMFGGLVEVYASWFRHSLLYI